MSSGPWAATAPRSLSGTQTHTTPAPDRSAASAASAGAPLMPGDPPTTSTPPASYFEPVGDRDGTSARSAGSMRKARGAPASAPGRPIGNSITSPAWPRPGSMAVPSVRPWKASVSAAWIAVPSTRPLAPSTPLGTSSATMGAASVVDAGHECLGGALEPSVKAAAEERIDDDIGVLRLELGHAERRRGRAHRARIVGRALGRRGDADADPEAGHVQVAGDDESVAPVVAGPAQHAHRDAVAIALAHGSGRLRAGTFHQRDAGQPELADCTPVELTYLFRVP